MTILRNKQLTLNVCDPPRCLNLLEVHALKDALAHTVLAEVAAGNTYRATGTQSLSLERSKHGCLHIDQRQERQKENPHASQGLTAHAHCAIGERFSQDSHAIAEERGEAALDDISRHTHRHAAMAQTLGKGVHVQREARSMRR